MRARTGLYRFLALLILTAFGSFAVFSQSTTLLRGTVTDPQGAVITGAVITLSNTATGFNRSVTTDSSGEYQFVQVAPGTYKIVADMVGFAQLDPQRRAVAGEHAHHARSSNGAR